jgi:hypothetical protein
VQGGFVLPLFRHWSLEELVGLLDGRTLGGCMSDITILYRKDKFAVSVDGAYQDIKTEADVLAKLLELGITRDRAEDAIATLKEKGEVKV